MNCKDDSGFRLWVSRSARQGLRVEVTRNDLASQYSSHGSGLSTWSWLLKQEGFADLPCSNSRPSSICELWQRASSPSIAVPRNPGLDGCSRAIRFGETRYPNRRAGLEGSSRSLSKSMLCECQEPNIAT